MKFFIGMIALAIAVAVSAEDGTGTAKKQVVREYEAQRGIPYTTLYTLGTLAPEAAQAELDKVKEIVIASNAVAAKASFAMAETVIYIKTNEIKDFAQVEKKYEEVLAEVKLPAELATEKDKDTVQYHLICAVNSWYAGGRKYPAYNAVMRECYEKFKSAPAGQQSSVAIGYQGLELGEDLAKILPFFTGTVDGKHKLLRKLIVEYHRIADAAPLFWELVVAGALNASECLNWYPQVLSYELGKEGYDATTLKNNINRAVLVYKTKARLWKGKEGQTNPYLLVIGMLQDTLKGLE